jgi:hypothetical protein
MTGVTLDFLREQRELGETLLAHRGTMFEPQDLPGRYGRVVAAIDHLLEVIGCGSVVAGGWAVWRHGYIGRMTQDIDIVLPKERIADFLRAATVGGFEILPQPEGCWPKARHKEIEGKVNVLPEGGRPGTSLRPAPTTIPHPEALGAAGSRLTYITLPALVELKLAAGRPREDSDVAELLRANPDQAPGIRNHLAAVHQDYVTRFEQLLQRAREQRDE